MTRIWFRRTCKSQASLNNVADRRQQGFIGCNPSKSGRTGSIRHQGYFVGPGISKTKSAAKAALCLNSSEVVGISCGATNQFLDWSSQSGISCLLSGISQDGGRTRTSLPRPGILSPVRLPISPPGHLLTDQTDSDGTCCRSEGVRGV